MTTRDVSDVFHEVVHVRPEVEHAMGFAQARRIGDDLHVAGVTSTDAAFAVLHPGDMAAQMGEVYRGIADLLKSQGFTLGDLIEERIFVTDMAAFVAANPIRIAILAGAMPATTAVEISALVLPGLVVEVACLARRAPAAL
jgi:enamine deaminase RidA (YjgF/YER057c/UK114 family)